MRTFHRFALVFIWFGRRRALIKGEEHVRAERMLDLNGSLWRESVKRAIKVRGKRHALIIDNRELSVLCRKFLVEDSDSFLSLFLRTSFLFAFGNLRDVTSKSSAKRKDLEATGIRHGRHSFAIFLPTHKRGEPACVLHDLLAGLQIKMIGISEHDLRPKRLKLAREYAFDACLGANRYERRSLNDSVRCRKGRSASPRLRVTRGNGE